MKEGKSTMVNIVTNWPDSDWPAGAASLPHSAVLQFSIADSCSSELQPLAFCCVTTLMQRTWRLWTPPPHDWLHCSGNSQRHGWATGDSNKQRIRQAMTPQRHSVSSDGRYFIVRSPLTEKSSQFRCGHQSRHFHLRRTCNEIINLISWHLQRRLGYGMQGLYKWFKRMMKSV